MSSDRDIYASKAIRGLLAEETAAFATDLQRCAATHALQISAAQRDVPPTLPTLGSWVRLELTDTGYAGDVRGAADEPLPFLADAFGLVVLRHALEVAPFPQELVAEAARVLAPGGMIALTGVHPASGWLPWLLWRSRHQELVFSSPLRLRYWLHGADLEVERSQRVGAIWPASGTMQHRGHPLGGGYLVVARKRRSAVLPVRLRPRVAAAPVGSLVTTARRGGAT
jgi:SAM-dependent methyltransferase